MAERSGAERRESARQNVQVFVNHILGEEAQCLCVSEDFSLDGLRLRRPADHLWGQPRFAWLQFRLPGGDGREIRALGELCYDGDGGDVRGYRFKYILPRDRRAYEAWFRGEMAAQAWQSHAEPQPAMAG